MIWLIFAVLTAGVILGMTRTLFRALPDGDAETSEIDAYKAQLQELDRDEARGTLGRTEARETRAEVSRRLLRASRQGAASASTKRTPLNASLALFAVALVLGVGSIVTYAFYGRPGTPDQPLEARLNTPFLEQTLDVQVANLERRLRRSPADGAGWVTLATIYFKNGLFDQAADTYRKAIRAGGENEGLLIGLTEALTFANDGLINDQAAQALQIALERYPNSVRGQFWSGLLAEQNGKKSEAEGIYNRLLAGDLPPALKRIVTQRLQTLATGVPAEEAAVPPEARGEEQKMIAGMIERLAARLKQDKTDLDGWVMLIRSYAVLKQADKAKATMAAAREQFAADKNALAQIDAITNELSFAFTSGEAAPAPNNAEAKAAAPDGGEQGEMIRGMVERLAARLKENKADLAGWLKLIRSYAVLKETDKAESAAETARREFASDTKALEEIDALAKGLGLASPVANGGQPKS